VAFFHHPIFQCDFFLRFSALKAAFRGAKILSMLQVNIIAVTELTRLVLPQMVARNRGKVMLLASVAAFQPGPGMAVYYATKAYVLSFGRAIGHELSGTGVTVTRAMPRLRPGVRRSSQVSSTGS
jgi:short-subunit dehydrogenase